MTAGEFRYSSEPSLMRRLATGRLVLGHRPRREPHSHISPAAKIGIEPHEDGHLNPLIVLVDLDVVETIYDPFKELDTERLIIQSDIDPVPWDGPWVRARRVRNRLISTDRVAKKGFLLPPGYQSHTPIINPLPLQAVAT